MHLIYSPCTYYFHRTSQALWHRNCWCLPFICIPPQFITVHMLAMTPICHPRSHWLCTYHQWWCPHCQHTHMRVCFLRSLLISIALHFLRVHALRWRLSMRYRLLSVVWLICCHITKKDLVTSENVTILLYLTILWGRSVGRVWPSDPSALCGVDSWGIFTWQLDSLTCLMSAERGLEGYVQWSSSPSI